MSCVGEWGIQVMIIFVEDGKQRNSRKTNEGFLCLQRTNDVGFWFSATSARLEQNSEFRCEWKKQVVRCSKNVPFHILEFNFYEIVLAHADNICSDDLFYGTMHVLTKSNPVQSIYLSLCRPNKIFDIAARNW